MSCSIGPLAQETGEGKVILISLLLQEVACTVVTCGDDCWVRLTDKESGMGLITASVS